MNDHNIKSKQSLIKQLCVVAEKEKAWLEKNRLLYTQKRERLDNLVKERGLNSSEVTVEERKLSEHVTIYESRQAGMWDLVFKINREEKNLAAMKARRKKKKEPSTETKIVKVSDELGYDLEPTASKQSKRSSKPKLASDSIVDMWRDRNDFDVASARSKQALAKRGLAGQLNTFSRCPYCEQKLSFERAHVDHIHPVSKGGLSEDDNLVLVCAPCNTAKSNKTLRAFCRDVDLNYEVVVARLEMIGKAV